MRPDHLNLWKDYKQELTSQTMKYGKILAGCGLPVISLTAVVEYLNYRLLIFPACRLLYLIPASLFLIMSYTVFQKNRTLVIPLHIVNLVGLMAMIFGLSLVRFQILAFPVAYKIATATGGLVAAIFVSFGFAAGARKYLIFIVSVPMMLLLLIINLSGRIPWQELTFFINPLCACLGAGAGSLFQEKLAYREFKARKLAEYRKTLLEYEIVERKQLEEKLKFQATMDELTGVYNRRGAFELLLKHLNVAREERKKLTICYMDLDNLKWINDLHGHSQGDRLLANFARFLQLSLRGPDIICRVGGDEFLVILSDCDLEEARIIVERITRHPLINEGNLQFSYGLAEYPGRGEFNINQLMETADQNMYKNKMENKQTVAGEG